MTTEDLYPLWIAQGRDELQEHVDRMQRGYDSLVHKNSTYGHSVKAILDLRVRLLETWDAAPRQLESQQAQSPHA
jgi:hypothetical protein